jgi:HPt (histidine-containing phosphotransfer) domain-containing protein
MMNLCDNQIIGRQQHQKNGNQQIIQTRFPEIVAPISSPNMEKIDMSEKSKVLANKLVALRKNYAKTLSGNVKEIHNHWKLLQTDWQPDSLGQWHRHIHRLAGTSLMYGFKQIGGIAKQLEKVTQPLKDSEKPLDKKQSQKIVALLSQLQQAAKHTAEG